MASPAMVTGLVEERATAFEASAMYQKPRSIELLLFMSGMPPCNKL